MSEIQQNEGRCGALPTSLRPPTNWQGSEQTAIEYFRWLNFREQIGHPLTNNIDFLELVRMAFAHKNLPC
jgi:hypothetical protein